MAKRFFSSEIWEEDWFLEMPNEYKQYWFYMLAKCDHAGIFRVNLRSFRGLIGVNLTSTRALELINNGKQRLRVIKEDVWLIEDFFVYQYGPKFSVKNRVHLSVAKVYEKYGINLTSIRGLIDPNDGVKEKDKDKDIGIKEEVGSIEDDKGGMGEKEGEKREEEGKGEIPPANMLLPQMQSVWTTTFPMYTANRELDYPALRSIATFILKTAGIANGFGDAECEIKVLNTFQLIADQVNREPFWANKALSTISKHIQEFYNNIKNPINGTGQKSGKNGSAIDEDKLKQKLTDKINKRRQAGSV